MGTLTYVAPELLKNQDDQDDYFRIESDMWSIGVIIFSLLCGYHPFDNDDEDDLVNLILCCDYEFKPERIWDSISKDCKKFIE